MYHSLNIYYELFENDAFPDSGLQLKNVPSSLFYILWFSESVPLHPAYVMKFYGESWFCKKTAFFLGYPCAINPSCY